ncbi:hypothetical protein [Streptomyces sp. NBC_01439]|uniref:hypothetical protein n=1 Tax=Streptomyces sp. NBC_01439 TaxID=2903867 RepID=UPI002E2A658B|nr:hypothetical protein [Streptomyces sp. NBC_01439]
MSKPISKTSLKGGTTRYRFVTDGPRRPDGRRRQMRRTPQITTMPSGPRDCFVRNAAEHVRVSRDAPRKAAFIEAIKQDRLFGVMLLTLTAERPAEACGTLWEQDFTTAAFPSGRGTRWCSVRDVL